MRVSLLPLSIALTLPILLRKDGIDLFHATCVPPPFVGKRVVFTIWVGTHTYNQNEDFEVLTVADEALRLWAALGEQELDLAEQRGWNHRLVNVLDALPTKPQAAASVLLRAMPYAESQAACEGIGMKLTG